MNSKKNQKDIILIVDDTHVNLQVLFHFLEDYGFKVLVAEDGESAIEMAEYTFPDLILLDVLMPGISGFETCQRLKANPATQDIPIIFMTALTDQVDKIKGLNIGAVDYITKPIENDEILARVNIHLRLRNLTKKLTEQNERWEVEIFERKRVEEKSRRHSAALAEWNNRYQALIQASGQILYDWNLLTNDIKYDGNVEEILGYSMSEMSGGLKRCIELIHPEDRNLFTQELKRVLSTNERLHLEFRMCRKDGTYITVEDNGYFFLDCTGKVARMAGFIIDVSERQAALCERKQAQAEREQAFVALQQSESRFRRLVESNIIGITLTDLSGNITEANDAFLQMLGYDREALLSGKLRWPDMTPLEYHSLDERAIAELISAGVSTPFEKEYIRQDGSRVPVVVGRALVEKSQQTTVGFVLDISDRKQAEQKIREQAALLDITTDAILVQDLDNRIKFWNQGAERLYEWMSEEVLGENANELLYKKQTLAQVKNIQKILAEDGSWQGELHQLTKQDKEIIVASRWTLVHDNQGHPKSILIVNSDITEKKQLEAQFLRAQRMESLGTLASGIAHDLNNALTPMMMTVQLLEAKPSDEKSQQWLSIMETNVKRVADLVKQVLWFSRGAEGKFKTLQVRVLISEIEKILKQTFSKTIEVCIDIPKQDQWKISGDATQLKQVLMNLCINARDAMPDGGILKISARTFWVDSNYARMNLDAKVGSYVMITVSDTGVGVPREIIDRIFEPFFTTKELGKGTGLGLSTVIGIVKSHGGFVNVVSEMAKGTEFQMCLPITKTIETDNKLVKHHELHTGNGEVILVVDDEDSIRKITKTCLEKNAYKVLLACDGIEAIALYTQHQKEISLVLIDMMMPSMDGPTAINVLKKINPNIKIIGVSGLASNHEMIKTLGDNIKIFMSKPYTSNDLLRNLHIVINTK
ncbi:hybrid sensor histidine kinase/response regulator [aff. Roholtiella sp. LEGE 12411]|uniref:hybrid sensor histidine kinase/response regulator n=1 Tax=aff. Roholtiella sp. LEGE 12411 TaxID=1828822 RepID=UPI001881F017|nr:response regulator [aff. Roholtiella sp. LEGE 12411]MBE9034414.1 response regulator [aff. Roholtiella sp. LEGE 12411]